MSELFAYGSLLDTGTMLARARTAERGPGATLADWRLTFRRGVADVRPALGRRVPGGLWRVSEDDLNALDTYEGVSAGAYWRYRLPVRTAAGEVWAWAYVMPPGGGDSGPPAPGYLRTGERGVRQWGWPTSELGQAVREALAGRREGAA